MRLSCGNDSFPVLPHAVDKLVGYSLQAMSTMSGAG